MITNNHTFPKVMIPQVLAYAGQPGLRDGVLTFICRRRFSGTLPGTIALQKDDGTFEVPLDAQFTISPVVGYKPATYPYLQATFTTA